MHAGAHAWVCIRVETRVWGWISFLDSLSPFLCRGQRATFRVQFPISTCTSWAQTHAVVRVGSKFLYVRDPLWFFFFFFEQQASLLVNLKPYLARLADQWLSGTCLFIYANRPVDPLCTKVYNVTRPQFNLIWPPHSNVILLFSMGTVWDHWRTGS